MKLPIYDGYQKGLSSIMQFFDKKTGSKSIVTSKVGVNKNEVLAEELHKRVIKKFKKKKNLHEV